VLGIDDVAVRPGAASNNCSPKQTIFFEAVMPVISEWQFHKPSFSVGLHLPSALILVVLAFMLQGCDSPDKTISRQIVVQLYSKSATTIDLRNVANGDWDRFCVIGPYALNDSIEKRLGFKWDALSKSSIGGNDTINLLVFIKEDAVIAYTEIPRNKGDFLELNPKCIPKANSLLSIRKDKNDRFQFVTADQASKP
jgi:hypothetical protein